MVVPNTYRNNSSTTVLPTTSNQINNNSSRINSNTVCSPQFTNGPRNDYTFSQKQQGSCTTFQGQNNEIRNRQINSNYGSGSHNVQYLGIPDRSSSPHVPSQQIHKAKTPERTSSPNLFDNREYGGTLEQIRNRFTYSPKNGFNVGSSPAQQYPLLEDLKNVSESEIRRNKKG